MTNEILETKLSEKYCNKRFTKKELEESLSYHFTYTKTKLKLKKKENPNKKIYDDCFTFSVNVENSEYEIELYYLKTNSGYLYVVEFIVEKIGE